MAKRRTGKRSVKRAFKKRRTIRKFRKTMRRYVQSGGEINPAITLIGGLIFAFVLAKFPKLVALLSVLGMVEMPKKGGAVMKGGIGFGGLIGNIKQSIPKAPFGLNPDSAINAAKEIVSKAQRKTIAVSKDTVINALNALKAAFNDDKAVDQATKTNITNCVNNLVRKITEAPPSAPENVTSEDMNESVQNAVTTPAPQGEAFDAMMKRVVKEKIDLLKKKLETAINTRILSFKKQYKLEDDDMKCIIDLMDDVLNELSNKKDSLFTEIMSDKKVKDAIEIAKNAGEIVSAGADMFKGKLSAALQQNPQSAAAISKFGSLFRK